MLQAMSARRQTTVITKTEGKPRFKGCRLLSILTITSTTIKIVMDLQAMEIVEIVILVDEVGCQSVCKMQRLIRLFVIMIM